MKAVLTIIEDHPSGQPAAMLAVADIGLSRERYEEILGVFNRWWKDGGGMFIVGHLEVLHVKKLDIEINGDEVKLVGTA